MCILSISKEFELECFYLIVQNCKLNSPTSDTFLRGFATIYQWDFLSAS